MSKKTEMERFYFSDDELKIVLECMDITIKHAGSNTAPVLFDLNRTVIMYLSEKQALNKT